MKFKNMRTLFLIFLILVFLAGIYVSFTYGLKINKLERFENDADNVDEDSSSSDSSSPSSDSNQCPDLLIRKGSGLALYNTKAPMIEGTNPILFNTLDDYIYYVKVQKYKLNIHCPILYLQEENNAQGQDVYRVRPGPFNLQGGSPVVESTSNFFNGSLGPYTGSVDQPVGQPSDNRDITVPYIDASRENKPYNQNNYPGFDPYGQFVGQYTTIDKIHDSTETGNPDSNLSDNPMDSNWGGVQFTHEKVATGKYDDNIVTKPSYSGSPNTSYISSLLSSPFQPESTQTNRSDSKFSG